MPPSHSSAWTSTTPRRTRFRLGDWLKAHGQDERTRRALWDLFSVSSINVPGDDASLALAAVVVKTGLLGDADAADIGVPALSLGELHGAAAARYLAKAGVTVRLQAKVAAIETKDGQFVIRLGQTRQQDVSAAYESSRAPDTLVDSAIGTAEASEDPATPGRRGG